MQLTGEGEDCSFGASLLIANCDGRDEYGQKVELGLVGVVLIYCEHSQHEALGLTLALKIVSSFERWIYLEQFSFPPVRGLTPVPKIVKWSVLRLLVERERVPAGRASSYQRGAAARKDRVKLDSGILPVDLRSPLRGMNNFTTTWAVSGTVSQARD